MDFLAALLAKADKGLSVRRERETPRSPPSLRFLLTNTFSGAKKKEKTKAIMQDSGRSEGRKTICALWRDESDKARWKA